MKLSATEQEEITKLLTRIYQDILAIESQYELLAGAGDYRCRIEYFHDAVQAFFSGKSEHMAEGGRLQVELLAYDVRCLRYLQQKPFASFSPKGKTLSAQTGLATKSSTPTKQHKRPDRTTRTRLSELYQYYAVLFATLLKITADDDFEQRSSSLNEDVRDINDVVNALKSSAVKAGDLDELIAEIDGLEDPQLHSELMAFIQAGKTKNKGELKKLLTYLKGRKKDKDKQLASLDKAHLGFATSQLALYETSSDLLKSLAQQGLNLVGKFVEASVAQTRREMGR